MVWTWFSFLNCVAFCLVLLYNLSLPPTLKKEHFSCRHFIRYFSLDCNESGCFTNRLPGSTCKKPGLPDPVVRLNSDILYRTSNCLYHEEVLRSVVFSHSHSHNFTFHKKHFTIHKKRRKYLLLRRFFFIRLINYCYTFVLPDINEITNNTKNIKNKTFAILAAPAAIPPKPNIPAMMARIIKMTVQRNIGFVFNL
jgi:hypothetical protein